MNDYISKQKVTDRMGCCLANAKAEYKAAKDEFTKARFGDYISAIQAMIDVVECSEAADVQSVRRGRWSECYTDTHHYSGICTVCGKASIKSLTESLYAFCPKCGAKMIKDGDTE